MCKLLSNNSLFVGQLYEDKSLALLARDLISLQLTSKQRTITQQFTARADLFLKRNLALKFSIYRYYVDL